MNSSLRIFPGVVLLQLWNLEKLDAFFDEFALLFGSGCAAYVAPVGFAEMYAQGFFGKAAAHVFKFAFDDL
jgi:hypothetical protein